MVIPLSIPESKVAGLVLRAREDPNRCECHRIPGSKGPVADGWHGEPQKRSLPGNCCCRSLPALQSAQRDWSRPVGEVNNTTRIKDARIRDIQMTEQAVVAAAGFESCDLGGSHIEDQF